MPFPVLELAQALFADPDGDGGGHMRPTALSIPASVIAAFVFGGLWYSPLLFARAWQKRIGKTKEELGRPWVPMIVTIVQLVIMAIPSYYAASLIVPELEPAWWWGLVVGAGIGFVFVAMPMATIYAYGKRGFVLWLIDSGYQIGTLCIIGTIVCDWHR
jgi:hypothetical protein